MVQTVKNISSRETFSVSTNAKQFWLMVFQNDSANTYQWDRQVFEKIGAFIHKAAHIKKIAHCSHSAVFYVRSLRIQYIPRNMHTVFALLCFVVVIHWLIFPYPSGLLHWHCGNLTIAPVPAKQPWWIWINTSCEFIMNDCITTTKKSTTKPCAYYLGYTVSLGITSLAWGSSIDK